MCWLYEPVEPVYDGARAETSQSEVFLHLLAGDSQQLGTVDIEGPVITLVLVLYLGAVPSGEARGL